MAGVLSGGAARGDDPATTASSTHTVNQGRLDETIKRGTAYLLSQQDEQGFWWAELESNVTMASEHLLLEHFLGIGEPGRWAKLRKYLLNRQQDDGSWPIYFGGPGNVSITTEAYFALKLAGEDATSPQMTRARDFIRTNGGVANTRIFTKIWLALFGQFDWGALPAMPPETILLPNRSPFNIYEFSSWARATIVAILVVWAHKPVVPVPDGRDVAELFLKPSDRSRIRFKRDRKPLTWRNAFLAFDGAIKLAERLPFKPLRKHALKRCEEWILEHQEADGSWGGIQPPWVYALIALKCQGYSNDHPAMARGISGLLNEFAVESEEEFTVQPCLSPVWDTALAVTGLREAGVPADDPALVRAGRWLLTKEIRSPGDWCVKVRNVVPSGWPFEFANDWYPDTDDTAEVLIALRLLRLGPEAESARHRANIWLGAMQSKNGGWGAFDVNNTKTFVTQIPFADFGATIDPPTEDVTAHIVEWFAIDGHLSGIPMMARALQYLRRTQETDGSWFGRWGVNYVYGLGAVVPALIAAGEDPQHARIRRAVRWLERFQNADGGWGESCASYDDPALRGSGVSTASQTAWAILALLAAGEIDNPACTRGINYLIEQQEGSGNWDEPWFTGTGFPRDFMLNYHLYRDIWPLWALGRYRRLRAGEPIHLPGTDPWR